MNRPPDFVELSISVPATASEVWELDRDPSWFVSGRGGSAVVSHEDGDTKTALHTSTEG